MLSASDQLHVLMLPSLHTKGRPAITCNSCIQGLVCAYSFIYIVKMMQDTCNTNHSQPFLPGGLCEQAYSKYPFLAARYM